MYINIPQPSGHPKHVNVTLSDNYVLLTTDKDQWVMDSYEARELGRMLKHAGEKLYKERAR